jgi:hypothetical protein
MVLERKGRTEFAEAESRYAHANSAVGCLLPFTGRVGAGFRIIESLDGFLFSLRYQKWHAHGGCAQASGVQEVPSRYFHLLPSEEMVLSDGCIWTDGAQLAFPSRRF